MAIPPYTVIPDARLIPDAPVRSVDAIALRDNPLAIAQADEADATPQVYTDGIADDAVTAAKVDWSTVCITLLSLGGIGYNQAAGAFNRSTFYADRLIPIGTTQNLFQVPGAIVPNPGEPRIHIPAGVTSLAVQVAAYSSVGPNPAHGIIVQVNGVNAIIGNLPFVGNWTWLPEVALVPGAVGDQNVSIFGYDTGAGPFTVYISGIKIRVSG